MGSVAYWVILILVNAGTLVFNTVVHNPWWAPYFINGFGIVYCSFGLMFSLAQRGSR